MHACHVRECARVAHALDFRAGAARGRYLPPFPLLPTPPALACRCSTRPSRHSAADSIGTGSSC